MLGLPMPSSLLALAEDNRKEPTSSGAGTFRTCRDSLTTSAHRGILLQKSLGCRTKILRAADAFCVRRREGPYRFIQNRFREIFRVFRFSTFARISPSVHGEAPEQDQQAIEVAGLLVVQPDVAGRSTRKFRFRDRFRQDSDGRCGSKGRTSASAERRH